jgi:hypothetical protein
MSDEAAVKWFKPKVRCSHIYVIQPIKLFSPLWALSRSNNQRCPMTGVGCEIN